VRPNAAAAAGRVRYNRRVTAPRAVLFDLDGTLVDTVPFVLACVHHAFADYGSAPTDAQWMAGMGTPLRLQLATFARRPEDVDAMQTRYRAFWYEHHDAWTRCFPGARETIAALAAAGAPLAIVTAKTKKGALRTLEHTGLLPYLGAVVCADSCARCKPDPEPVHLALRELGVPASRAVMVGDAVHDVIAGCAAGVLSFGAGWGVSSVETLMAAGAERVLSDIRELPGVLAGLTAAAA
jgi:pyrophosphatase PpaX